VVERLGQGILADTVTSEALPSACPFHAGRILLRAPPPFFAGLQEEVQHRFPTAHAAAWRTSLGHPTLIAQALNGRRVPDRRAVAGLSTFAEIVKQPTPGLTGTQALFSRTNGESCRYGAFPGAAASTTGNCLNRGRRGEMTLSFQVRTDPFPDPRGRIPSFLDSVC